MTFVPFPPRLEPGDPGRIATEPQVREPRMPWDSPRESRLYRPHDICLTPDPCRTCNPRASLRPLLTWALAIFLAGAIAGSAVTFLAQSSVLGALLSTSYRSFAVESSAARAADRGTDLVEAWPRAQLGDVPRSAPPVPARANSHADDDAPMGSEAAMAPQPSVTTHPYDGLREDPSAPVVLGSSAFPTKIEVAKQEPPDVEAIIRASAAEFGVDPDEQLALALCESTLRVDAVGLAQEIGLFQWRPRTWESNAPRLGYTIADITDPVAQARLTALVFREDGGWRWSCAK